MLPYDTFLNALRDSEVDALKARPVLVIAEHEECGHRLAHVMRARGIDVVLCSGLRDAQAQLAREGFSLVCASDALPDGDLQMVVKAAGSTPVIAFSRAAAWNPHLDVTHAGAIDCMVCPSTPAEPGETPRCAILESSEASGHR
jgi:DNA-binding response OmpR family regulator